jgi:competence protein ComEA
MKKILLAVAMLFALINFAFAAVNINTANKDELDAVKGIGPVKAQAIIDYRQKNGQFKSVDDLKNVKGFGDKSVAKIKDDLSVSGASSAPKKAEVKAEDKPAKAEKKEEAKKEEVKKAEPKKEEAKSDKKDAKGDTADKKPTKAEKKEAKKAAQAEKEAKDKEAKDAKK